MSDCECATAFEVRLARQTDYAPFKKLLDRGKHPAFIGKSSFTNNATNGGCLMFFHHGEMVAVSMMNPHMGILTALNVLPSHRRHGLGAAVVRFLVPNFVRAVEHRVAWFESLGYRKVGALKPGVSLNTQVMVREALFGLAGRLRIAWGDQPGKTPTSHGTEKTGAAAGS